MNKTTLFRLIAVLGLAFTVFGATQPAQAGTPNPVRRTLDITVCENIFVFGPPSGCSTSRPSREMWLLNYTRTGVAWDYPNTSGQRVGRYEFAPDRSTLVITYPNPSPRVLSTVLTGATYPSGGYYCYRGSIRSVMLGGAVVDGVWFGCIRP